MKTIACALLCAISAPAFALTYDEAVSGDITGDEIVPTNLGALSPGLNIVRGTVDPYQDSFIVDLPPGFQVLDATATVTSFVSLGQVGYFRFFQPTSFLATQPNFVVSDGVIPLDITGIDGFVPLGFTATSVGPSGAVYNYEVVITVGKPCTGGTVLWNEWLSGDITGDEISPTGLADLGPGTYVVCGSVDPFQDSFEVGLFPDTEITAATLDVEGYQSRGQDGYTRMFQTSPFDVFSQLYVTADGSYPYNVFEAGATNPMGFSVSSVGPQGATYDYKLTFVVEQVIRPRITPSTPPAAGRSTTFNLNNLTPGQRVYLVGGQSPGATPVGICPGASSGIASPRVLATGRASRNGTFSTTVPIPAALAGRRVFLQALDPATCEFSFVYPFSL